MKIFSTPLLASVILIVTGSILATVAGNPSPRQIEENPALIRPTASAKKTMCKVCVIDGNAAYRRSPRAIEEHPELVRTATCAAEIPVKALGFSFGARTPAWPRILETR